MRKTEAQICATCSIMVKAPPQRGVFMGKIPLAGGIAGNNRVNYLWYMHKEFGII